ncbi:MAG: tetratricopeptide repeat protein [Tepidisphaeraceae bacterium]
MPGPDIAQLLAAAIEHHQRAQLEQAEQGYQRVLQIEPDNARALHLLGVLAHQCGQHAESVELISRAISLNTDFADAHANISSPLMELGRLDEAMAHCERAAQLNPRLAAAHVNRASVMLRWGKTGEAIVSLGRAVQLAPDDPLPHTNLAKALRESGRPHEAIREYDRALELGGNPTDLRVNRAIALLSTGDFARGLPDYESRLSLPGLNDVARDMPAPRWDGRPLDGRVVLLRREQGFGDMINFVRYTPIIVERGGVVTVSAHPSMVRLLAGARGVASVVRDDEPLPPHDFYIPIGSLPLVFGTTPESIPAVVPYLVVDNAEAIARWRSRVESDSPNAFRVGIAWAGNPRQMHDRSRSTTLAAFAPLAGARDVVFFNLQFGPAAAQMDSAPAGMRIVDYTRELHDFLDTATLMQSLDLIISVDTATSHLAGALARPVWTVLGSPADWRYPLDRDDCPWYPTMRLFRRECEGDWRPVFTRLAEELRQVTPGR